LYSFGEIRSPKSFAKLADFCDELVKTNKFFRFAYHNKKANFFLIMATKKNLHAAVENFLPF